MEESVDLLRIMRWYFDNYPIIIFVKLVKISKNSRPNWNDYSIHSRFLWKKESSFETDFENVIIPRRRERSLNRENQRIVRFHLEREREREGESSLQGLRGSLAYASKHQLQRSFSLKEKNSFRQNSPLSSLEIIDISNDTWYSFEFSRGGREGEGGWNGFEIVVVQTEDVTHRLPREKERIDRFLCQSWDKRIRNWIFIEG